MSPVLNVAIYGLAQAPQSYMELSCSQRWLQFHGCKWPRSHWSVPRVDAWDGMVDAQRKRQGMAETNHPIIMNNYLKKWVKSLHEQLAMGIWMPAMWRPALKNHKHQKPSAEGVCWWLMDNPPAIVGNTQQQELKLGLNQHFVDSHFWLMISGHHSVDELPHRSPAISGTITQSWDGLTNTAVPARSRVAC